MSEISCDEILENDLGENLVLESEKRMQISEFGRRLIRSSFIPPIATNYMEKQYKTAMNPVFSMKDYIELAEQIINTDQGQLLI
jgi:hypothetical protein